MSTQVEKFDVIGDVHGCFYEMESLVALLGYDVDGNHPESRKLVFVGDITDRGYYSSLCLQWVLRNWEAGRVLWVQGNHDNKLFRWMKGNPVSPTHGLESTIRDLTAWPFDRSKEDMGTFLLDSVPTELILDHGNACVVHAYPCAKSSLRMYGPKSGDNRIEWWKTYAGSQKVIFGHYWITEDNIGKNWCCVDTCCVLGESLSALRYPEWEMVSVPAAKAYFVNYG